VISIITNTRGIHSLSPFRGRRNDHSEQQHDKSPYSGHDASLIPFKPVLFCHYEDVEMDFLSRNTMSRLVAMTLWHPLSRLHLFSLAHCRQARWPLGAATHDKSPHLSCSYYLLYTRGRRDGHYQQQQQQWNKPSHPSRSCSLLPI
jgi:hypothetical protein